MKLTSLAGLSLCGGAVGFGVAPRSTRAVIGSSSALSAIRCFDKYYQLEELEDKESCTTELFLRADGVVEFGETDGPQFLAAAGTWSVPDGTDDFNMVVTRVFSAGQDDSDMGEFNFELSKTYRGDMTMVGASVGVTGVMATADTVDGSEREVGYFNMIDVTDERMGDEKKV
eukprot:CAMPEP_0176061244 /NCGR_PEP_ID=MMETSP0120_2-20121206/30534_1 /TAXON_ID=160619 /ORGANISM="Kryptoperidinium foliaceum, Strain CCMP 1326" /LENGTH=171 /DNA_ID=CAMNT_0017394801 /DNA_START=127 /DNA_END=642 /DNA_ORIENTATION=+